jgi:hypothetical protein
VVATTQVKDEFVAVFSQAGIKSEGPFWKRPVASKPIPKRRGEGRERLVWQEQLAFNVELFENSSYENDGIKLCKQIKKLNLKSAENKGLYLKLEYK